MVEISLGLVHMKNRVAAVEEHQHLMMRMRMRLQHQS